MNRPLIGLTGLLLISSCSWFGGDDDVEEIVPTELTKINEEVKIRSLWSAKLGKGADDKAVKLVPAVVASRVFAASADGKVAALQANNGRKIWEQKVKSFYSDAESKHAFSDDVDVITGGVGVGADIVVVGTAAGELVALNQSDGSLAWRTRTSSEVLAPPQIDKDLVVAHTIDGKVAGYNALDGERLWLYSTSIPSLTLRGTSTPIISDKFVIAGFANGRFALLDREKGIAGADERVAVAAGRSDLERLVDIDGNMVVAGGNLFVASFQGRLAAINLQTGRLAWGRDASSMAGLGEGFGNIYIAHADSLLGAVDMASGRDVWEIEALLHRDITAPVSTGSYIAVGDFEGYLHVIAQSDGRFVGRRRVDSDGILSPVVADGNRLFVMGNSGRLSTFEIQ
ncbi:MAG: outer membrane protein assembly factor BamB [Gammaproteobacteria bacterium]|jgi:outer membrane protein assembly factor BamB|nr:outer membrane protein assembly factor BamB [Gammaproteobacteria bacterium]|tara:strand:+ start:195 stop:1391 length:1197 start_codon:yes stop_codon:yes gene_type:complete